MAAVAATEPWTTSTWLDRILAGAGGTEAPGPEAASSAAGAAAFGGDADAFFGSLMMDELPSRTSTCNRGEAITPKWKKHFP